MNKRLFWIGIFVVSMMLLFVAMLFSFGLASRLTPKVKIESYFPESVQGLTEGAAVKYKGVPIGSVRGIAIQDTGIAERLANGILNVCGTSPIVVMTAICFVATFITEFMDRYPKSRAYHVPATFSTTAAWSRASAVDVL